MEKNIRIVNTVCPRNCYSGCGMEVHMSGDQILKVKGSEANKATRGKVCLKGLSYHQLLDSKERLLYPLKKVGPRDSGQFEIISWMQALMIIKEKFQKLIDDYGPKSLMYYQGSGNHGSVMQEYAYGFWYQLGGFTTVRGNLCDPAGVTAIKYTYGEMKQNSMTSIESSKLILLWGKNPSFTNVHSMYHILKAKKSGAKLVVIDPRLNESSQQSDLHLQPRSGTDGLLAMGIAKLMIQNGSIDHNFIENQVKGFPEYLTYLDTLSMADICRITEVTLDKIEILAAYIKDAGPFTLILGKGLQRYSNGGQTTRAIIALPALCGAIGKDGCGLYFNDGQRPSQQWPYYPPKPEGIRDNINMGRLSTDLGEVTDPPIKALWVQGGNPMTSNPNRNKLKDNLMNLDFMVVAEQFMTDTAQLADLVLPVAMFLEENDLIRSYGHSYIQLKQKVVESPGECLTDKDIFHHLGMAFGMNMDYLPEDDEEILKEVIKLSGYHTSLETLKEEPYLFEAYDPIAYKNLTFETKSGKIELLCQGLEEDWGITSIPTYVEPYESKFSDPELFEQYPLQFMSCHAKGKINSQFSQTKWVDELTEPLVQLHKKDAENRQIREGDAVRIYNNRGEIIVKAQVGEVVKQGNVNVFEGEYDRTGASVNVLTEDRPTDIGYGAAFHNCLVQIEKVLG